jgi:Arylsulfotransferase (ASST)
VNGERQVRRRMRHVGSTAGLAAVISCLAAAAVALGARPTTPRHPAGAQGLDVLPFPGTPDAAPTTNVDFPAVSPAQLASVIVVGSRSGLHMGRLSPQPAGNGSAFSPDHPFAPGERVSVTATFRSVTAGSASGAPGSKRVRFSFSVARVAGFASTEKLGTLTDTAALADSHSAASSRPRTHSFATEPGFTPPVVTMRGRDPDTAAGDIFLDAVNSGQNAAYILNPRGALLWYNPAASSRGKQLKVHDLRVQRYLGHRVLTYWQGRTEEPPGGGRGVDLILNKHYQTIRTIKPGNGLQNRGADSHEFLLGHEGREATAFIEVWKPVDRNLTSVGGPSDGPTFDWIIQEIDIATGKVIWEWHSLGHVPINSSYLRYVTGVPYDYFHMNSIQQLRDGNILISSRNTWAVYLINKKTGRIMWKLGGKHSSFKMGPRTHFEWQHDATLHSNGLLTLFDDGATPKEERQSRALELHLDMTKRRVTLVHQYLHSPATLAGSEGSVQLLRDHNVFVGWGNKPYFSEYAPSGKQLFGGSFGPRINSYRAYRFGWIGSPLQPPAIAVRPSKTAGQDLVYASWNGSTQVRKWQVLTSKSQTGPFKRAGSPASWLGFQTKMRKRSASYFEVQALGARGAVLGTSAVVAGP